MYNILENVTLNYENISVLKNFNLNIDENKINCVLGPSGCGKTSIMRIIAGLNNEYTGKVNLKTSKISYIFQEDRLLPWSTVLENIKIVKEDGSYEEVYEIINALDLMGFENKYPSQLSGGMKQRCAIGRGFYYDAPIFLMDEPFKSLDYDLRFNMVKYLCKLWNKKKKTIILITHNIDEALLLGHKIIVLSKKPTAIKNMYSIDENLLERSVVSENLVSVRSKIINDLKE